MISPAEFTAIAGHFESSELFDKFTFPKSGKAIKNKKRNERRDNFPAKATALLLFIQIIVLILSFLFLFLLYQSGTHEAIPFRGEIWLPLC
jgi:hypothetical protein